MRNEPGEGRFPATCARCGGRVSEPVSFCPHCGTHARLAFGDEVPREAPSPKPGADVPLADALWTSRPRPLFAATDFDRYADIRPPVGHSGRQWGVTGGTALILVLFVALYGGAVLLHRHNDASTQAQQHTLRMAQGTVQAGTADVAQPGRERNSEAHRVPSSDGVAAAPAASSTEPQSVSKMAAQAVPAAPAAPATTSAPAASPATDRSPGSAVVQPSAPAMAAAAPPTSVMPPVSSEQPVAPTPSVAAVPPAASGQIDLSARQDERAQQRTEQSSRSRESVAAVVVPQARSEKPPPVSTSRSVRQSLARPPARAASSMQEETRGERRQASVAGGRGHPQGTLSNKKHTAPRRAITAAQAAEPQSSDAFMLQQDLLSREKARDSALSSARACIVQEQWNCAWHNAGSALAIDSSSVEAKALFNRAFVESGAAARPAGPGPDGPAVPMLTQ
jgi:hypothetical protein